MTRLVTFGDSYTYGDGLEDCWIQHPKHGWRSGHAPSRFAWPSLLAKDLGYKVDNQARPGFSNIAILHQMLNFDLTTDDVVIIMWSFPERDMIFHKNYIPNPFMINELEVNYTSRVSKMGSWIDTDLAKYWSLTHNDTDLVMRSWYHIHHANLYLSSLNIPHYNFFVNWQAFEPLQPRYINIPFKDACNWNNTDRALDGRHPGPLTHARLAKDIKMCLVEDSII